METNSTKKNGKKRKECQNFVQKVCVHTVIGQSNNDLDYPRVQGNDTRVSLQLPLNKASGKS